MKKSEFIRKVLKSRKNTVFVNKEQVENALEVFEKIGMVPPKGQIKQRSIWHEDSVMFDPAQDGITLKSLKIVETENE